MKNIERYGKILGNKRPDVWRGIANTILQGAYWAVATYLAAYLILRYTLSTSQLAPLISSMAVLASLLPLAYWKIARSTAFLAFPAAFASLILMEEVMKKRELKRFKNFLTKKSVSAILLLFVVSLSATSMVLRFRTNQYFGEMYHPSESSSLSAVFRVRQAYRAHSSLFLLQGDS